MLQPLILDQWTTMSLLKPLIYYPTIQNILMTNWSSSEMFKMSFNIFLGNEYNYY